MGALKTTSAQAETQTNKFESESRACFFFKLIMEASVY